MKSTALTVAGFIFTIVCILQFLRYVKAWALVIDQFHVPVQWSLIAGIVTGILALWMFVAARK